MSKETPNNSSEIPLRRKITATGARARFTDFSEPTIFREKKVDSNLVLFSENAPLNRILYRAINLANELKRNDADPARIVEEVVEFMRAQRPGIKLIISTSFPYMIIAELEDNKAAILYTQSAVLFDT